MHRTMILVAALAIGWSGAAFAQGGGGGGVPAGVSRSDQIGGSPGSTLGSRTGSSGQEVPATAHHYTHHHRHHAARRSHGATPATASSGSGAAGPGATGSGATGSGETGSNTTGSTTH